MVGCVTMKASIVLARHDVLRALGVDQRFGAQETEVGSRRQRSRRGGARGRAACAPGRPGRAAAPPPSPGEQQSSIDHARTPPGRRRRVGGRSCAVRRPSRSTVRRATLLARRLRPALGPAAARINVRRWPLAPPSPWLPSRGWRSRRRATRRRPVGVRVGCREGRAVLPHLALLLLARVGRDRRTATTIAGDGGRLGTLIRVTPRVGIDAPERGQTAAGGDATALRRVEGTAGLARGHGTARRLRPRGRRSCGSATRDINGWLMRPGSRLGVPRPLPRRIRRLLRARARGARRPARALEPRERRIYTRPGNGATSRPASRTGPDRTTTRELLGESARARRRIDAAEPAPPLAPVRRAPPSRRGCADLRRLAPLRDQGQHQSQRQASITCPAAPSYATHADRRSAGRALVLLGRPRRAPAGWRAPRA